MSCLALTGALGMHLSFSSECPYCQVGAAQYFVLLVRVLRGV